MSIISDLQTKKLGLFELVAMGFDLYLKKSRIFLGLYLVLLPFLISLLGSSGYFRYNPSLSSGILSFLFWIFYMFAVVPLYTAILLIVTESCIFQQDIQLRAVVERISPCALPLMGLWITFCTRFFLFLLLLIVPGIVYSTNNCFCLYALVLRDQKGKAAFQYSRSLVKENWWKVFFLNLLTTLIVFGLQAIFAKILNIVIPPSILVNIISSVLTQLIATGVAISGVLLFFNLEFQKQ